MLSVSNLVNVTISLSQLGAVGRSFNVGMIAGDSGVISGLERLRTYNNISDVQADFGLSAPEALAAALYFSQTPKPSALMIGSWLRTAQAAQNQGAILTAAQQALTNFNAISNGAFNIAIDGTVQNLTGINFNNVTNLNGVASAVNLALTGALCTWNGEEFVITSNTLGAGVGASGSITFTGPGTAADTITIGGTSIELVASAPTGNEVLIGANAAATAGNLWTFLQNSSDVNIVKCSYVLNGAIITVTDKTVGTIGNAFTLAKSSTAITLSGGTLAGGVAVSSVGFATAPGSGFDISTLLGLTAATSLALVPGYAAETPEACVAALASVSAGWYGMMFAASVQPTDDQSMAVSSFVEALQTTRMYAVTTQETASLSSLSTTDLGSRMKAAGFEQSFVDYCSTTPYEVASVLGRMAGVDFTQANSTIDLMYKQLPGVTPEAINDSQAAVLKSKNINVFASYDNGTQLYQYGLTSSGFAIDTIWGSDWFQNNVQTKVFNVLYTSPTKVPQTDPGINQLTNACNSAGDDAVNNAFAAPGQWNGPAIGSLQTGQYLKTGYYVFTPSVSSQSQADRDQRIAPPMQIALKLAGAVNTVPDLLVTINQ